MSNITSTILTSTVYQNNKTIKTVNLDYVPWVNNTMDSAFANCSNITTVTNINENVSKMRSSFSGCKNLTTITNLPMNVRDLRYAFNGCTNLSGDIIIPNKAMDLYRMLQYANNISDCHVESRAITTGGLFGYYSTRPLQINVYIPFGNSTTYKSMYNNSQTNVTYIEHPNCSTEGEWYYMDHENSSDIMSYIGNNNSITIPSTINNKQMTLYMTNMFTTDSNVTHVYVENNGLSGLYGGDYCFYNCKNLIYTNAVGSSLNQSFTYCSNLQSVDGLSKINTCETMYRAFYDCSNLQSVDGLPKECPNMSYAFYDCCNLNSIPELPSNVTDMSYSLYGCRNVNSIPTIPNSVVDISSAFTYTNISVAPTIPNSVVNMYRAFRGTKIKTAPNIPSSAIDVTNAFQSCELLTKPSEIPNTLTSISGLYSYCNNLTTLPNIPNTVTDMSWFIAGSQHLTNKVSIHNGVTNIASLWQGHDSLTTLSHINIPNSVTDMSGTFSSCDNLSDASGLNIPNSVTEFNETFDYCYNLVIPPIIPNSVVNMYGTFGFCSNLTTAPVIPNSVVNLNDTFRNCPFTTAPNIPENVVDMANTFKWCDNLTGDIYIHSEYVSTFNECFVSSYKPKTIYMPFNSQTPRQVQLYAYTNMDMYMTYYVEKIPTYDDYNGVSVYDSEGTKVPNCMAQGDEYSVSITWTDSGEGWPLYCSRDEASDKFVEKYASQTYESFMADYGNTYNSLYNITLKDINSL